VRKFDFCVVDVETANHSRHSICQIGVACFQAGKMVESWQSLVDPEEPFNGFNVALHGIGPELVAGAPNWEGVFPEVVRLLEGEAVASHTDFDRAALTLACEKAQLEPVAYGKWLDTCRLARAAFPETPNHKLTTLARCFSIHYKAHDALEDARVAGMVLAMALERRGVSVAELLAMPVRHIGSFPGDKTEAPRKRAQAFQLRTKAF
jgi:DNA polymerase-3 subunit epsilon